MNKNLDYSQFHCTLEVTKNEAILLNELLHTIKVKPQSLTYQCAKNLIQQLNNPKNR